jgi:hypothetical protein
MKSVGSNLSKSLSFFMKGLIVWYFVSDTHKVMTSLILVLFALVCPELTQYCLVTTFFFYLPVC